MDVDEKVARLATRSRIGRLGRSAFDRLRLDGRRSSVGGALRQLRAHVNALTSAERVRLAGVLIVVSTLTNALLLEWSPSMIRPLAPTLLRLEIATVGLVMIVLSAPIARGWTHSQIRRILSRARKSPPQIGDEA